MNTPLQNYNHNFSNVIANCNDQSSHAASPNLTYLQTIENDIGTKYPILGYIISLCISRNSGYLYPEKYYYIIEKLFRFLKYFIISFHTNINDSNALLLHLAFTTFSIP